MLVSCIVWRCRINFKDSSNRIILVWRIKSLLRILPSISLRTLNSQKTSIRCWNRKVCLANVQIISWRSIKLWPQFSILEIETLSYRVWSSMKIGTSMIPILTVPLFFFFKPVQRSTCLFGGVFLRRLVDFILIVDSWNHTVVLVVVTLPRLKISLIDLLFLMSHVTWVPQLLVYHHLAVEQISVHILLLFSLVLQHLLNTPHLLYLLIHIITFHLVYLSLILFFHFFGSLLFAYHIKIENFIQFSVHFPAI